MLSFKIWMVVAMSFCCHGSRLENEISKKKLGEDRLLKLVSSLRDQITALETDVSYIRRKTKQSYEILKSECTPNTERQDVALARGECSVLLLVQNVPF